MHTHIWLRRSLRLAAVLNVLAGLAFTIAPWQPLFGLPAAAQPFYAILSGAIVCLFGITYGWLAAQEELDRALLAVGASGKTLAVAIAGAMVATGQITPAAALLISGDLLFAGYWFAWLLKKRAVSVPGAVDARAAVPLDRAPVEFAPDGSKARPLAATSRASLCHCELAPDRTSSPVAHRSVDELWFFLDGEGEFHSADVNDGQPLKVAGGASVAIRAGTTFQFRNTRTDVPLSFVVATVPPWPGNGEADTGVKGFWD